MRQLRPGVWALESSSSWGCNSYLVATAGRVLLVDPGPSFQLNPVARELSWPVVPILSHTRGHAVASASNHEGRSGHGWGELQDGLSGDQ